MVLATSSRVNAGQLRQRGGRTEADQNKDQYLAIQQCHCASLSNSDSQGGSQARPAVADIKART